MSTAAAKDEAPLGQIDRDLAGTLNERVRFRMPSNRREVFRRNQWVRVHDAHGGGVDYLGRIIAGPFFPSEESAPGSSGAEAAALVGEIEIEGMLRAGGVQDADSRPAPGAAVYGLSEAETINLLGCLGDMRMGVVSGQENIAVHLQSKSKGVLPRNLGVFGTVGSGKSNTAQVLIEEAAAAGWAVVVLDVEGEYTLMDSPADLADLPGAADASRPPRGLADYKVLYPASCPGERPGSEPYTLRLADFESGMIAEFLDASVPERNALVDLISYFEHHAGAKVQTNAKEHLTALLNAAPEAKVPFHLGTLKERATERGPRGTDQLDYVGLAAKLQRLMESGAFDLPHMAALDPVQLTRPGRVSVIDVSAANDTIRNLVTADLLRKLFAYKMTQAEAAPTLLVIEEAHTFISRERVQVMQATLQMLRDVSRRGRKRWLALAFVSQQPAHLPPEIFELCNTRFVHGLRSMHNLEALMTTAGDVGQEFWDHCPMLGPGEAIVSSPQFRRPLLVKIRPASSQRKFTR